MLKRLAPWAAALALLCLPGLPGRAAVDQAICSTADAGAVCSGTEYITSANEELVELYKLAPRVLASVAGTNTITASATPAVTAYADGQLFQLQPAADNTGAVTININGVGAVALTDTGGGSLASGAISASRVYLIRYRAASGHFRLVTPGLTVTIQVFSASGTYTKPAGLVAALVTSTGGGGGGGGADASSATSSYAAGGGGGGGGTCIEYFTAAQIGTTETVTIGAAGTAGADTGGNGGNGGNTTFGALHTAAGGSGGTGANPGANTTTAGTGGAGGACTGGLINLTGAAGRAGRPHSGPNSFIDINGGDGGGGHYGATARGGRAIATGSNAGGAGPVPGAGGAGAAAHTTTTGAAGGAGAAGLVIVQEFRN